MTDMIETETQRRQREYLEQVVATAPPAEADSFEEAVEIAKRMQAEVQSAE